MTSSVLLTDKFIDSFSKTMILMITSKPDFESLKQLWQLLKNNATSIKTECGGRINNYIGIVITPEAYANIDPTPWASPPYPGSQPQFDDNLVHDEKTDIRKEHAENLCQWWEFISLQAALHKQLEKWSRCFTNQSTYNPSSTSTPNSTNSQCRTSSRTYS